MNGSEYSKEPTISNNGNGQYGYDKRNKARNTRPRGGQSEMYPTQFQKPHNAFTVVPVRNETNHG